MIIRVYNGHGSSVYGSAILIEEFKKYLRADIEGIGHGEMRRSKKWMEETDLLVFSAKSVTQFKEALGENVLQEIQRGVYDGAFDYAGICAGASFASATIRYRMKPVKSKGEIVIRNTGLSFFNGHATGPSRSVNPLPFSGESENLHLVGLSDTVSGHRYNSFFWGGPALIPTCRIEPGAGRILSVLDTDGSIMSLRVAHGRGNVTICAHHPEINAGNVGRWAEKRTLSEIEWKRLEQLAARVDGSAFRQFLSDAKLFPALPEMKKTAVPRPF